MLRRNLLGSSIVCSIITILSTRPSAWAVTLWAVDSQHNSGGESIVTFDSANPAGTIHTIGHTGFSGFVSGLDFDSAGNLFIATSPLSSAGNFYKIDQATGHATLIGPLNLAAPDHDLTDITWNPAVGRMYGVAFDGTDNFLYTIDTATGAGTLVGALDSPGSIVLGLCSDASGQMYTEDFGGQMRTLNGLTATPMSAQIGVWTWFSQGMCMDWSGDGKWYAATTFSDGPIFAMSSGDVRVIDKTTGGTAQVLGAWPNINQGQSSQFPLYSIGDVAVRPIPEPGTSLLLATLATLGATRKFGRGFIARIN
jgi:WD40 repeat protein